MNIKDLQLFTKKLEEQKTFYTELLGLELLTENETSQLKHKILEDEKESNVNEKKASYNKGVNAIIETIFKEGLEKAMNLYTSE